MATAAAEATRAPVVEESAAARILRVLGKTPVHMLLIFVALLWLVPTLGLFLTSIIVPEAYLEGGWWQIFSEPSIGTLQNYKDIFDNESITRALVTTIIISVGGTAIPIFVAALAGYAFAWLEFPGRDWLFIVVVALLVVPLQMALIPILKIYSGASLYGTFVGIWLAHTAFGLPLAIFLLYNFMSQLPRDLFESSAIDGASAFQTFIQIVLPLSVPALGAFAIFQFLWVWNDLLVALVFLGPGADVRVMPTALFNLLGAYGGAWHLLTAGAFLTMVVPMVVFLALQRFFVRGILAGSVK
jgi:alpha-glucoside transport system permease protein